MPVLRSRSNPRLLRWQRLLRDPRLRRTERRALIEGPHLVASYLACGATPHALLVAESALKRSDIVSLLRRSQLVPVVMRDALFRSLADAETPIGIAAEISIPRQSSALENAPSCVFLEGIQDPGNVGTILRSAAAFGISTVVLAHGCADPWSPRVLRAAMGGHFLLHIAHSDQLPEDIARFGGTVVGTLPRGGTPLDEAHLRGRVAWIFGTEGRGISAAAAACTHLSVTIPMPGGAESLNVAAAAAICFYERARQLSTCRARS